MKHNVEPIQISGIPENATASIVERHADGSAYRIDYYVKGERVGTRYYDANGVLDGEFAFTNGRLHGMQYRWHGNGRLLSAEPYVDGIAHGMAYQWAEDGTLVGAYSMEHGSGVDLWWETLCIEPRLAEVHYMQNGQPHGWEWWVNWDQESARIERHWVQGLKHGIEREWNLEGRLRRGFPRYWIKDERVAKRTYLRVAASDPTLPPFRLPDNDPRREFPPEIAAHLKPHQTTP